MSDADAGHFGPFGGRFVAETLIPALDELERRLARRARRTPRSAPSSTRCSPTTSGGPSPLTTPTGSSRAVGGASACAST